MRWKLNARGLRSPRALFRDLTLLQRFMILCAILMTAMALLLGQRVSDNVTRDMERSTAFNTALYVGGMLGSELETSDGTLQVHTDNRRLLDMLFSEDRLGAEIVSVKVWSRDGEVIYASDKELIGRRFPIGPDLQKALSGSVEYDAEMPQKEENAAERKEYKHLLEIYAPIHSQTSSEVIGASEIYQRVDRIPGFIASSVHEVWILVGLAFLVLFLALSGIVRKASNTIARQNAQLQDANKTLEENAVTDFLTQLYNHRYFQDRLLEEVARSSRLQQPLSLLFCDLDYFKAFNDRYGHQAGDVVLRSIAQVIKDTVRATDTAARYGGEEYAIILRDTDKSGAAAIAERLRRSVQGHRIVLPGGQHAHVTMSIGVATFPLDARLKEILIREADRAMYQAKNLGRNRIVECAAAA